MSENAARQQATVTEIHTGEQWDGKSGLTDLNNKLDNAGLDRLVHLRENSFEVSNRIYVFFCFTLAFAGIISGIVSMTVGYTSAPSHGFGLLQAALYFTVQAMLLFMGTIIGSMLHGRINKCFLGIPVLMLALPLFALLVCTGMAQQYQMQSGDVGNPILTLFTSLDPTDPTGMQRHYNYLVIITFELALLCAPIILFSVTSPIRERWELAKISKAAIQKEDSRRDLTSMIAQSEAREYSHKGELALLQSNNKIDTNLMILEGQIDGENRLHKIWDKKDYIEENGFFGKTKVKVKKAAPQEVVNAMFGVKKPQPRQRLSTRRRTTPKKS